MRDYQKDFIEFSIGCGVLQFGDFVLKSGRGSPYFFNTGLFASGAKLGKLGCFYAKALLASGVSADVLYGPAYKGIPLVAATAIAYAQLSGQDIPYAFNRKEAKDHGEGGLLVGAPLRGDVVIVDDVITAGTSARESIAIIRQAQARPAAVLCALDRQEKGAGEVSAPQQLMLDHGIPVIAIVSLATIVDYLCEAGATAQVAAIDAYRRQYGSA